MARFPTVVHARAFLVFDVSLETLQRSILQALFEVQKEPRPMKVSLADHDGYVDGAATFRVGVGNHLGFNRLDEKMVERLLMRIEERGPFETLDIAVHLGYSIKDGKRHNPRGDRYIGRIQFSLERAELLLHLVNGLRRIQPDELVHILVFLVNLKLVREKYAPLELETLHTT